MNGLTKQHFECALDALSEQYASKNGNASLAAAMDAVLKTDVGMDLYSGMCSTEIRRVY